MENQWPVGCLRPTMYTYQWQTLIWAITFQPVLPHPSFKCRYSLNWARHHLSLLLRAPNSCSEFCWTTLYHLARPKGHHCTMKRNGSRNSRGSEGGRSASSSYSPSSWMLMLHENAISTHYHPRSLTHSLRSRCLILSEKDTRWRAKTLKPSSWSGGGWQI